MARVCRVVVTTLCALVTASFAHGANHVVTVGASTFSPQTLTIRIGDTVTWSNPAGASAHNVVSDTPGLFSSGSATVGPWSFSFTFTITGTFGYYCAPHGGPGLGQFGTIVVIDAIELSHGSDLYDDLNGAPDRYRFSQKPFSSYEVVVEPVSGNPSLQLDRTDAAGTTVLQSGEAISSAIDMTQSLRWINNTGSTIDVNRIRVATGNCTTASTSCSANETYRLRAYETTYAVPRYNQSGTQVSVVILQNPNNYQITGLVYFWNAAGTLLNASGHAFTLAPRAALVLNAGTVAGVNGTSGTVTIVHDGRYGDLVGKVVALEPATGFSFDTMGVYKPK